MKRMQPIVEILIASLVVSGCGEILPVESSSDGGVEVREDDAGGADGSFASAMGSDAARDMDVAVVVTVPAFLYAPSSQSPFFSDDFERADNVNVGNGWSETVGGGFSIVSGNVALFALGSSYRAVVYRPCGIADVEISASFTLGGSIDETALYARMQPEETGKMGAYSAWVGVAKIEITHYYKTPTGGGRVTLAQASLLPSLVVGKSYRLFLRVSGANPVKVEAAVFDGASLIASVTRNDASANRLVESGSAGFGSRELQQTSWQDVVLKTLD